MAARARKQTAFDVWQLIEKSGIETAAQACGGRVALYGKLVADIDAYIAAETLPFDKGDNTRDRLFALMMQRIDVLQDHRAAFLKIIMALLQRPQDLRALGTPLYASLQTILRLADAPHTPAHIGALGVAYTATIAAWRNDTSADLSKTMKACDRALSVLENIANLL